MSDGLESNEESKQSRALKLRDEENTENEDSTKSVVTPKTVPFAQIGGGWYQNQIICYNFYKIEH